MLLEISFPTKFTSFFFPSQNCLWKSANHWQILVSLRRTRSHWSVSCPGPMWMSSGSRYGTQWYFHFWLLWKWMRAFNFTSKGCKSELLLYSFEMALFPLCFLNCPGQHSLLLYPEFIYQLEIEICLELIVNSWGLAAQNVVGRSTVLSFSSHIEILTQVL